MAKVSYALREDPNTIFLLQDAGKRYDKYCQIAVFGRRIVRPEFLGQYMYFAPYTGHVGKYYGSVTDLRMSIEDNAFVPARDYVAVIDSEVEFRISPSVIRQLCQDHMPAWGMKSYLNYFSDRKSGILLFVRVYKVNQALSPLYLAKGVRGSSQVIKLYNELEEEVSLPIDGIVPVISDNKFSYLKEEILHLLKVDDALIALYDNSKNGLDSLRERVIAERQFTGTHILWENRKTQWLDSDDESDFDMAQLDYEAIYQKVQEICPSMEGIIDYVREIQAARIGEYDYHLNNVHTHSADEKASFERLFDMSLRSAVKTALYYYNKNGIELEDAFQAACIGIIMAIQRHNDNVKGLFPSYVAMRMRQVLSRDFPLYNNNVYIPVHYCSRIDQVLEQASHVVEKSDLDILSHDEVYHLLLNNTDCTDDEAYRIAYIIDPAESVEQILDDSKCEGMFAGEDAELNEVMKLSELECVYKALDVLNDREREVIVNRFGFDGNSESSLENIGQILGVTRERVRQIETKALRKIRDQLFVQGYITKDQYDAEVEETGRRHVRARKHRVMNNHKRNPD